MPCVALECQPKKVLAAGVRTSGIDFPSALPAEEGCDQVAGSGSSSGRTLPEVIRRSAGVFGEKPAVIIAGACYTYREVWDRALRAAAALQGLGVAAGDPVLIMLPNRIEMVDVWIGLSLVGAVEVPVNTELVGEVLRHQVTSSRARMIVIDGACCEQFVAAVPEHERPFAVTVGEAPSAVAHGSAAHMSWAERQQCHEGRWPSEATLAAPTEHDRLAVMYTSGTTGLAKGVVISQVHAYTYAQAAADLLQLQPGDRYLAPLPLFHIAGQWALVLACLQTGATAVVPERFSATAFWDAVRQYDVTASFLLGAMANMLFRQDELPSDSDNPLQRVLMVPLVDDLARFRARFGVEVCTCYGSTESNVPIIGDYQVTDPTVAGRAAPGYLLRVADEFDYEVPSGAVGELLVRCDAPWQIATAYHTGSSADTFRNFWLHTGDAFRREADGTYHFVDRIRDYIRRRGENISSADVEREVNAHPAVLESAAVAFASDFGEDDVAVFVVPRAQGGIQPDELIAFLSGRLPRFMVPSRVEVLDELPKTPTGKIRKHVLRDSLSGRPPAG
jgi:carnitine-CoA ligase